MSIFPEGHLYESMGRDELIMCLTEADKRLSTADRALRLCRDDYRCARDERDDLARRLTIAESARKKEEA